VHSDNDEESLYACCCTQKVTVKGAIDTVSWLSQSTDTFTKFNEVNLQLQGNGVNLIKAKSAIFTFFSKFNVVQTKSSPS